MIENTPFKIFLASLSFFILAALYFHFIGPIPLTINQTVLNKQTTFEVTAEGQAVAVPDTAEINLGITAEAKTILEAQNQANKVMNNLTDKLLALGLKKEKIKTISYNVFPKHEYKEGKDQIVGYTVETTVEVKVEDLNKINQVIDSATALGINQVGQLNLTVNEQKREELLAAARQEAIKNAKAKAEGLAQAAGVRLGKIINITEGPAYNFRSYASAPLATATETAPTQIQPGETQIKVSITLSYELL